MENDILTSKGTDNLELVQYMPRLQPNEVAKALVFAICSSPDVLVTKTYFTGLKHFLIIVNIFSHI